MLERFPFRLFFLFYELKSFSLEVILVYDAFFVGIFLNIFSRRMMNAFVIKVRLAYCG